MESKKKKKAASMESKKKKKTQKRKRDEDAPKVRVICEKTSINPWLNIFAHFDR